MRRFSYVLVMLILCASCAPAPTAIPTTLSAPTATIAPPTPTADVGHAITFTTADGVTLHGFVYGVGPVAIIFSNMGDQHPDSWTLMAQAAAQAGYTALTYDFRYWVNNKMDQRLMPLVGEDLKAAVAFMRAQGAQKVAVVGASMGGIATAQTAASIQADAVVVIAAPMQAPGIELEVLVEDVQAITAPKLFITSERDDTVPAAALLAMHAAAREPKELYIYPAATAHGTHLFNTAHGADLQARLLAFLMAAVPPSARAP